MAVKQHVADRDFSARGSRRREWKAIPSGGWTSTWDLADFPDKTFQFSGTPGGSLSITAYGSSLDSDAKGNPDPSAGGGWYILKDANGNNLTKTSINTGEVAQQAPRYVACKVDGDGSTSIDITIQAWRRN